MEIINSTHPLFTFYAVISCVFGLSIGSFLNVVALRSLWNEEFVKSRSRCPKCRHDLNWYNNIPVLSFIFQGGKCQFCKCKISPQYPIIEALCGVLFLLTYLSFGISIKSLFILILISFFILITITDLKEKVVFDWHTYPIIALGLLYNGLNLGDVSIISSLIGVAVGFIVFEILAAMGHLFANSRAFGFGDTIIAMGLGAFFGWKMLILIVLLSLILQTIIAIPMLFFRALKEKNYKMNFALVLVVLSIFAVKLFEYFDFYSSLIKILPALIITFVVLLWCLKVILGNMKNKKQEELFYLPFGPSLVAAATFVLFFKDLIKF